ncbi:MAG: hypothetical protein C0410_06630 [Anaerolinea sp.]|nr:hypothetical protein [Anaerolinea sp.]
MSRTLLRVNPYDFLHPVTDPKLFAGREMESRDVTYYLNMVRSPKCRSYNIAIIGERSIGKTSFLYKIEDIAKKEGLLPVRFVLTQELVKNSLEFFKHLFDAILEMGHERGMYNGRTASIYQAYKYATAQLKVDTENYGYPSLPFNVVRSYIGHKLQKVTELSISQADLKHDLLEIQREAKSNNIPGIVLMIDEANLFTHNNDLLQALRNIFEEPELTVSALLAGTPEMFKMLSSTYSPILRQFINVYITGFNRQDTEDCILRPLDENERLYFDRTCVDEIHRLTGGNPYEVQLICHFMYRYWEDHHLPKIILNHQIIDHVLDQLEEQRRSKSTHIAEIKSFPPSMLNDLKLIIPFEGWTTEEIAKYHLISEGLEADNKADPEKKVELAKKKVISIVEAMRGKRLIDVENGRLFFTGDRFEKLYLKYFAEAQGIEWGQITQPFDLSVMQNINMVVEETKLRRGFMRKLTPTEKGISVKEYVNRWKKDLEDGILIVEEQQTELFVVEKHGLVKSFVYSLRRPEFFRQLLADRNQTKKLLAVKYQFDQTAGGNTYLDIYIPGRHISTDKAKQIMLNALMNRRRTLEILGCSVDEVESFEIKIESLERIADHASRMSNDSLIREIQLAYITLGRDVFADDDVDRSIELFTTAVNMKVKGADPLYLGIAYNNLGFVSVVKERYEDAFHYWATALALYPPAFGKLAMTYQDMSYVHIKLKHWTEALKACRDAIEADQGKDTQVGWLWVKFCPTKYETPKSWKWELQVKPRVITCSYLNMVTINSENQDFDAAKNCLDKAMHLSPDHSCVHRAKGWLDLRLNDWKNALSSFEKAASLDPKNPIIEEEIEIAARLLHEKLL